MTDTPTSLNTLPHSLMNPDGQATPDAARRSDSKQALSMQAGLFLAAILAIYFTVQSTTQPTASSAQFVPSLANINPAQASSTQTLAVPPSAPHMQPISNAKQASVHGATITSTADGWLAAWYGGTREGAKDVQIFTANKAYGLADAIDGDHTKTPEQQGTVAHWQEPKALLSRTVLSKQLDRYIKKLGNPMLYTTADGKIWLFFVSVSVGGWAGSALNVMVSTDDGATFSAPRRLTTSPFFNVSTLVRNHPISLANGGMVLPIYHEFIGKFCELLWLDADGNIQNKQRLSWGRQTLQPSIVAKNGKTAAVFMRISAPKTHLEVAITHDSGRTFSPPEPINLPNANAAIDASLLPNGDWLLVYNHDPDGRDKLSLATASHPLGPWAQRAVIDQYRAETGYRRFSYPTIVGTQSGSSSGNRANNQYKLLYTVERSFIQSVTFNADWLNQQPVLNPNTVTQKAFTLKTKNTGKRDSAP